MQKRKVVTSSWRAVALFLAILAIACTGAESPETPVTQPTLSGEPTLTQTTAPGSASASGPQAEVTTPPVALQPVDEVVFIEEPDYDKVLGRIEAGEVHLYAFGTSDPTRERRIQDSPVVDQYVSYGSSAELTINPVGPTFPSTEELNPIHVPAIREAMNWLVDRQPYRGRNLWRAGRPPVFTPEYHLPGLRPPGRRCQGDWRYATDITPSRPGLSSPKR